ncbi:MAG: LamG domain-containing protein [Thermoanaerobaculia bacterium]
MLIGSHHRGFSLAIFALVLGLPLFASAAAAQSASEPFNYPANSPIAGKNLGTGWAGPWTGSSNVATTGLTYSGLVPAPSGKALGPTTLGPADFRSLATPIVGTAGTSMVLSALIRSDVNGTPATQATLGNSTGGTFIIGDLPQPDPKAGNWGYQTSAGRFYSNVPVAANATTYLVAQIDFNVSGNNDRIRFWVNPPANAWFTVPPDIDDSTSDVPVFSGVFWQTQQGQIVDEIRVMATKTACVQPPNTTMVAWYPFDETSGPTALNYATANDGMWINGPTPVPGMVGNALHFDGVNDYVESPSSIVTNFGPAGFPMTGSGGWSTSQGDFSIDTWVRIPSTATTGVMVIVDKRDGNPPAIKGYSLFVYNNQIGLQLADGVGTGFSNYFSAALAPNLYNGNWHHLTVTVKRTSSTGIRFYHNGVPAGTASPLARVGSLVNNSPLRIGTRTAASPLSGWYQGDLDELEIFNRVLTPAEVLGLYTAGPFGKCR